MHVLECLRGAGSNERRRKRSASSLSLPPCIPLDTDNNPPTCGSPRETKGNRSKLTIYKGGATTRTLDKERDRREWDRMGCNRSDPSIPILPLLFQRGSRTWLERGKVSQVSRLVPTSGSRPRIVFVKTGEPIETDRVKIKFKIGEIIVSVCNPDKWHERNEIWGYGASNNGASPSL